MDEIKRILAKNLSILRKSKNITQSQLAKELNYSDKSVSKWENGDTVPDISVLNQIAKFYGVTVDFLITDNHETNIIQKIDKQKRVNTILVMALFTSIIWICATIIYSQLRIWLDRNMWTLFIWAVPASALMLIILAKYWLKIPFSFVLSSVFLWTTLASFHLQFFSYHMWVVYFIGIPCQIALSLISSLSKRGGPVTEDDIKKEKANNKYDIENLDFDD